jgi:RimJ/RimL family protein N-acetyltransferase
MISFREATKEDAKLLLDWRTSSHVSMYMETDITYDIVAQENWLISARTKKSYYHWIILDDGVPAGLINLNNYSPQQASISWGFYIGSQASNGLGAFIPPYFYNFLFKKLLIENIHVEVFYNNLNAIGLHLLHGYKFSPSNDRVIKKNNRDILLISMVLHKSSWNFRRFRNSQADFPTVFWENHPVFIP